MDTKKIGRTFDIVDGPNKDALFDACKYVMSKNSHVAVEFTVALGYTMPKSDPGCAYIRMSIADIQILGIEHEDGSGESFNLHGACKADPNTIGGSNAVYSSYRFKAYYNVRTREGTIVLIES